MDSKPGTLYRSPKVQNPLKDGLPSFGPILSAIGTPTYTLAKFLLLIFSDIRQNEFTVKFQLKTVTPAWLVWMLMLYSSTSH